MALPTVLDVNNQVRSIVADTATDYLTDALLLPYVQRAYRKAARVLRAAGVRLLVKEATISAVPAATTHLDRTGAGTLYGADLIRPLVLRERLSSTPTAAWSQMSQQQEMLYDRTATTKRESWDWRSDSIYFPAASGNTDIQIRYEADLPALSSNSSEILIVDGMDAVALMTAAYTAQARDEQNNSAKFIELAMDDLNNLIQSELGAKAARTASFGRQ